MTPAKPGDPEKGKAAEQEQVEHAAAQSKRKAAKGQQEKPDPQLQEPPAQQQPTAEEGAKAAKPRRVRKPRAKAKAEQPAPEPAAEAGEATPQADTQASERPAEKASQAAAQPSERGAPRTRRAPKAARGGAARAARRRVVRARARYVRTSARKARMVCGHLRGKSVQEARAILAFTPREVARDWSKLLESAVANAESNHELVEDDLIVRDAYADEGPTIKRFRPRAMGRATPIRKRTSHLTITLTPAPERPTNNRKG
jgi:ribosomal protein L22